MVSSILSLHKLNMCRKFMHMVLGVLVVLWMTFLEVSPPFSNISVKIVMENRLLGVIVGEMSF